MISPPSLRKRIRNGTFAMLALAVMLGTLALPEVHQLGGAIRLTLYRNYKSIDASQHMHAALWTLQIAQGDGDLANALAPMRAQFMHWIGIEERDITEAGEGALAHDMDRRARRLFDELAAAPKIGRGAEFAQLHRMLDRLIAINSDAMFRADSLSSRMSDRLTYEFAGGLVLLLVFGAMLSWTLAWNIAKPLDELAEYLRSFSLKGPSVRLRDQPLAELQAVASEFNRMAERLEQFEKLNVDRIIYEKSKTEAIIESLEDGIVLIDPNGAVTHINEIAAIILGLERDEALGSRFDDLDSNHPHYLRVRSALRSAVSPAAGVNPVEVELHMRGRDHTYVLKPVPLREGEGDSFGTILILQDITYLRDKDRARTNLVATLSHELKTPLTSLALSAELLDRAKAGMPPQERELIGTINEDLRRLRNLAGDLLDLARGESGTISIRAMPVDMGDLAEAVMKTFALQAERKRVRLVAGVKAVALNIRADPVKLSWVISNLIANALRYTPEGGSISLSAGEADGRVRVTVADSGPGIPPEIRDHLFERYTQGSVNGAEPGSAGLGLAIAKEIIEAHGGRIFVESAMGEGTSFTIEVPSRIDAPPAR
jgi:NtrC-family two-component system sensor histidine kinase KinB